MAEEKKTSTKNKRVVKKDEDMEQNITMSPKQFQELIQETIKTALNQSKGVSPEVKAEVTTNVQATLATKINNRVREGEQFFAYLSDSKGPRKRIVIDKIYREYVGDKITATVNGSTVKVPVDGKQHWVHPAHYSAIKNKLSYISSVRDRAAEGPDMFGNDVGDYKQVRQGS